MFSSTWSYIALALTAAVLGLFALLRISWGNIHTLQAEKIILQRDFDGVKADLNISVENHNRIVSENNRMMTAERDRAAAEQSAAVESARIAKISNMQQTAKAVSIVILCSVFCAGCGTLSSTAPPARPSIQYQAGAGRPRAAVAVPAAISGN